MITKVINTSNFLVNINNFSKNKSTKYVHPNIKNLSMDTVTFSGKANQEFIDKTVNRAFKKLRDNSILQNEYSGITKNKIIVNILETSYDNDLILTLKNLKQNNQKYALFQFIKQNNHPSKIISLGQNYTVTDIKTIKMINGILKDLK